VLSARHTDRILDAAWSLPKAANIHPLMSVLTLKEPSA
jgi:hypothetical protein